MTTLLFFVNKILALGTMLGQIFILFSVFYFLVFPEFKNKALELVKKHGMLLAFIVSVLSVASSLFYSQIVGFAPCELCWFQRIFMYPQVVLLGLALIKKDSRITDYGIWLAIFGGLISLYHNYMYYFAGGLNAFCQIAGRGVSCTQRYVFEFGYVTIPLMALTGFALVIVFLLFAKKYNNQLK